MSWVKAALNKHEPVFANLSSRVYDSLLVNAGWQAPTMSVLHIICNQSRPQGCLTMPCLTGYVSEEDAAFESASSPIL